MLLLRLLACASLLEPAPQAGPVAASTGGPTGPGAPTNVVPWVLVPRGAEGTAATPTSSELREFRLVGKRGEPVAARASSAPMADGALIRLTPEAPLAPGTDYRILAPGALMLTFRTGTARDPLPPVGGALVAWSWDAANCPTLNLHTTAVQDASPLRWEVEATVDARPDAPLRSIHPWHPPTAPPAPSAPRNTDVLLTGCKGGNFSLPDTDLNLRLRWLDAADNAGEWSPSVRIPTSTMNAEGTVPGAVSYTP